MYAIFHSLYVPHLLYPFLCCWTLGCSHVLTIINSAVVNIGMPVSFRILVSSRYMLRSGLAGSCGRSSFSFFKECRVAVPIYIPTNSIGGFPFFNTLSTIYCRIFNDGHSDWYEVIPHCSFDVHFPNNSWCWASFPVPLGPLCVINVSFQIHWLYSFP